jgi:predicted esterase
MTFNGQTMPSWYDIHGLGPEFNEDDEGVKESAKYIQGLIEQEIKGGIPSNKILLVGASQGGAIALYSGLTYDKPLSGILALSTYLPLHKTFEKVSFEMLKSFC